MAQRRKKEIQETNGPLTSLITKKNNNTKKKIKTLMQNSTTTHFPKKNPSYK